MTKRGALRFAVFAGISLLSVFGGYSQLAAIMEGEGVFAALCKGTLISGGIFLLSLAGILAFRKWSLRKWYWILGVYFGAMFILIVPTGCTPDEIAHFDSAYELSNEMQGNGGVELYGLMLKRESDVGYEEHLISNDTYEAYYQTFEGKTYDELTVVRNGGAFHSLVYLPGAVGITVAKILHFNYGWTTVLGTVFQMLFFLVAVSYSMYLLPFGKKTLFVVALLPMTLQQASSYSYDNMAIAMSILVVSISLRWMTDQQDTRRQRRLQAVLFVAAALMLSQAKGGLYMILVLLPAGMIIKRIRGKKKAMVAAGLALLLLAVLAVILWNAGGLGEKMQRLLITPHYIEERDLLGGSIHYYLTHPALTATIFARTILTCGKEYLFSMMGGLLGWYQIVIPGKIIWVILAVLLLSLFRTEKDVGEIKKGQRIYILLLCILICVLCLAAMLLFWTSFLSPVIEGVQGRYFLPVLFAALIAVGYWKKPCLAGTFQEDFFVFSMAILDFLVLVFILKEAAAF